MTDPRYYDAVRAADLAAAGKFRLAGRTLKAFSLAHALQLEFLGNPLWVKSRRKARRIDFIEAAVVCSFEGFLPEFPQISREEMVAFHAERDVAAWVEYIQTCYGARPELRRPADSLGDSPFKAPDEEFIITFILRHAQGMTRRELFAAPAALVYWIFEAISEQVLGRSQIITPAEKIALKAASTPEAKADVARREKIAGRIFKVCGADTATRMRLLGQLEAHKLPKDWEKRYWGAKGGKGRGR